MKQKFILFYIACSFFACKPEERLPNEYNYYYLTADQLGKTPYFNNPDFDTLTFVSNLQDTLVFAKTTTDSSFYLVLSGDVGTGVDTYDYHQQIKINYQTLKGNGSFGVEHVLFDPNGYGGDFIYFYFNGLRFKCLHLHVGRITFYTFKDSIEINNRVFNDLIVLYSTPNDNTTNEGYVNQKLGLFYVIDKAKNQNFLLLN
jgi:hypothetical protein